MIPISESNFRNLHIRSINEFVEKIDLLPQKIFIPGKTKVFYKKPVTDNYNPIELLILNTQVSKITELDFLMNFILSDTNLLLLLPNKRLQISCHIEDINTNLRVRKSLANKQYEIKDAQSHYAYFIN